jgi:predicted metalloprotease with PDZ domain
MIRHRALALALAVGITGSPPVPGTLAVHGGPAAAVAPPVVYDVSFPNAVHHEARVAVAFHGLRTGRPLEVLMARSSPGRYALHEFAKNVYGVTAADGRGRPLAVTHPSPSEWRVPHHDGTVRLTYTVFADEADGTHSGIDLTHAHLNMPATFMFARIYDERPIRVTFHPLDSWKIATQLEPTADPATFTAPHLQYFMDSPAELSDFSLRQWHDGPGGRYTLRLAVHHAGDEADVDRFAEMAKRVVDEEEAVFGELPPYDHGTYTFIADYLPWLFRDGMEHRNSAVLTRGTPLAEDMVGKLGTLAHEHFHAWSMERLRDRALEPFDFEAANPSDHLWFGEGFTSYYDDLVVTRAGFASREDFAATLSPVLDRVINSPARRFFSAEEMSRQAPFADGATWGDATNANNTFLSYYDGGETIGLALDLTLRQHYGVTLDDYMRALWRKYGWAQENETPTRPYTGKDLRATLAEVTGDADFADDFFGRYIEGSDVADFAALLAPAGFVLRPAHPGWASMGPVSLEFEGSVGRLSAPTLIDTPAYEAGLENGDQLIGVDGRPIASDDDLDAALAAHKPGDTVTVAYEQRGQLRSVPVRLVEDHRLEVVTYEQAGRPVTDDIVAFRAAWLGSRAR